MGKGPKLHLKRLHAPKNWGLTKMGGVFATRPASGPHRARECLPLLVFVRNFLGYANTAKEAVKIIERGHFVVNGKSRKSPKFPVGLMDVVCVPALKSTFRVIYTANGKWTIASELFDAETATQPLPVDLLQQSLAVDDKEEEKTVTVADLANSFADATPAPTAPRTETSVESVPLSFLLPCKVRTRRIGYKKMVGFNRAAESPVDRNIPFVTTECGRTLRFVDKKIVAGDTVLVRISSVVNKDGSYEVAEQTVEEHLRFEEDKLAFVVRGKNVGRVGKVRLVEKHVRLSDVVYLEDERGNKFVTKKENVMVIGDSESAIGLARDRGVRMNLAQQVKWDLEHEREPIKL